jgi:hypothetical protein
MKYADHCNDLEPLSVGCAPVYLDDFVWSTSEEGKIRALSLYLIRSIVERRGGTVDVNLMTGTVHVDVPDDEQMASVEAIED